MASKTEAICSILCLSLFLFLSMPNTALASINASAVFAFGDSTIDSGNNNHFHTLFRSDHYPYGRDFPSQVPTGRFSDGKISTDYLTQILGIKNLLPAYLDPKVKDQDLLTGVSFGSGGSGLDPHTVGMTKALDLNGQFVLFEKCLERIRRLVGDERTNEILENAVFVISTGTNDMLYNAYLFPTDLFHYGSLSAYQDFVLKKLHNFVEKLYGAGARRIMVAGLPPIGCLPLQVTIGSLLPGEHWMKRVCSVQQNVESEEYNNKLQSHIHLLQSHLDGAKIAYFDIYSPMEDMILSPAKYGFNETLQGCCGTGFLEMGPVCNVFDPICPDPSKYLFWDAVHLTQAAYKFLAQSGQQNVLPYITS